MAFLTKTTWLDVPRDQPAFLAFLYGVMTVLEADTPPQPAEACPQCTYRREMEEFEHPPSNPSQGVLLD